VKYTGIKYYRLLAAIADCDFLLAQDNSVGAYYRALQVGLRPIITDIPTIDEAKQAVIDGSISNHRGKIP
jgi:hypothetical protein